MNELLEKLGIDGINRIKLRMQDLIIFFDCKKISSNLDECIESITKDMLLLFSRMFGFDDLKYERKKFIKKSIEAFTDENIKLLFSVLGKRYLDIMKHMAKNNGEAIQEMHNILEKSSDIELLNDLCSIGLCYRCISKEQGAFCYSMPKQILKNYNDNLLGKNSKVFEYIEGILNITGITDIEYIYRLLTNECGFKMDYSTFLIYIYAYSQLHSNCYNYNGNLVTIHIDKDDIDKYLESSSTIEYLEFSKELIETYSESFLVTSPMIMELESYLIKQKISVKKSTIHLIAEYMRNTLEFDIEYVLSLLREKGVELKGDILDKTVEHIGNAYNDTRLYKLRGAKPRELSKEYWLKEEDLKGYLPKNVFLLKLKEDYVYNQKLDYKVGRNDPCYCGSGKKYKKCCMNIKILK